jgi:hypothetical protein
MKIHENARIQRSQPSVSQAEIKKESVNTLNQNSLGASEALNVSDQKITAETSSVANLKAGMLQRSLANELSARSEKFNKVASGLLPRVHTMINESGKNPQKFISKVHDELKASDYKNLGSLPDGDIEAIAFLVLMQATKTAQEDLKSIMAEVKSINASKQHWRQLMEKAEAAHHSKLDDDDD